MPWAKQFDTDAALEKAMQMFWRRGYEATSMQDLVDCMGVNRGSMYATYGDKHAIFVAALLRYDENRRRQFIADIESRLPPREAIRALFDGFMSGVNESSSSKGCFLTNTALELAAHDPEVAKIVSHSQEEIEAFFLRSVRAGKARGEISVSVKPTEAARGLLASLIGMIVLSRSRPNKPLLRSVLDDALKRLD